MTVTITPVDTWTSPPESIADGEPLDSAHIAGIGDQHQANRSQFIFNRLFGTAPPPSINGARRLWTFASVAEAEGETSMNDNDVAMIVGAGAPIAGGGPYVFKASSTAPVDHILVLGGGAPTGRWMHALQPIIGAANGLATLNAAGRSAQLPPNAIIELHGAELADASGVAATAFVDLALSVTVAGARVGDHVLVDWGFRGSGGGAGNLAAQLLAVDGSAANLVASRFVDGSSFTSDGLSAERTYAGVYTVRSTGALVLKTQARSTTGAVQQFKDGYLRATLIRP